MAAAAIDTGKYQYTATGILGDKRDTMLGNQILLRSQLGRPLERGYTSYPGEEYRYGRPNPANNGGAGEALRGWSSGIYFPSAKGASSSQGGSKSAGAGNRDFMALNREAVISGLTTATENYQFRASHDIRRKPQTEEGKKSTGSRRLPTTMVFGIPTRPSTPIHDLLENKYQDKWLDERRGTNLQSRETGQTQKCGSSKVYETRASLLRQHQVPVEPAPLWKMPRFSKNARPSLQTFRDEASRSKGFDNHKSDCIARQGFIGHGVYHQAKN